jgi:hypothetical protein
LDVIDAALVLFDDLHNPVGARFDQDSAAVHHRVTIVPNAIFRRHIIIGDTFLRQNCANPDILAILIGRVTPLNDIIVEAGTLIDAQNAGYPADHTANDAADNGTDRTRGSFAFSRASFNSTGNPLGLHYDRKRHEGGNSCYSDKTTDHDISYWCRLM